MTTLARFALAMWLATVAICIVMAVTLRGLMLFVDWLFA